MKKIVVQGIIFLSSLFLLELFVRTFFKNEVIFSCIGDGKNNYFNTDGRYKNIKYYPARIEKGETFNKGSEFKYKLVLNNLFLFDTCNNKSPDILGLGDSFTFGFGAPFDSSWVKCLERESGLSTLNAGFSGSNPWNEFNLLKSLFHQGVKPKKVIFCINSANINRMVMTGDKQIYKMLSKCDHFFLTRFFYRLCLNKFKLLIIEREILSVIKKTKNICRENNSHLLIVFTPLKDELKENKKYFHSLEIKLKNQNIDFIDLVDSMKPEDVANFYWEKDGHFNSKGYLFMAQVINEN